MIYNSISITLTSTYLQQQWLKRIDMIELLSIYLRIGNITSEEKKLLLKSYKKKQSRWWTSKNQDSYDTLMEFLRLKEIEERKGEKKCQKQNNQS